jgi:hypothetical protein
MRNLDNLTVWHNAGADVDNGMWAKYGARLGTYMTMLTDWDHTHVQWFDNIAQLWDSHKNANIVDQIKTLGIALNNKLGLPTDMLNKEQSKFFKRHYRRDFRNLGTLVTEMEVIRRIEGW